MFHAAQQPVVPCGRCGPCGQRRTGNDIVTSIPRPTDPLGSVTRVSGSVREEAWIEPHAAFHDSSSGLRLADLAASGRETGACGDVEAIPENRNSASQDEVVAVVGEWFASTVRASKEVA